MARKLRIAATSFFALLAFALVILWWRSFWTSDEFILDVSSAMRQKYIVSSFHGAIRTEHEFGWTKSAFEFRTRPANVAVSSTPISSDLVQLPEWQYGTRIPTIPHWCLVAAMGFTAAACSPRQKFEYRFSVRAMLLATTIFAVVLMLVGELFH